MKKFGLMMYVCRHKMKSFLRIPFIIALIWNFTLVAQINNSSFFREGGSAMKIKPTKTLGYNIDIFNFVRNNEYFGALDPGHTFFGYQFMPSIVWVPSKSNNLSFRGGLFLLKNFGESGFKRSRITFTMEYKVKQTRFLFGTIEGALSHKLIEPLYRFERALEDRIEDGFQLKHSSKRLWADVWVDWRATTELGSNRQEEIRAGLSSEYFLLGENQSLKDSIEHNNSLKAITQATILHRGGSFVPQPIISRSNFALGLDYSYFFQKNFSLFVQPFFLYSVDHSIQIKQPFKDGWAYYLNLGVRKSRFTGMLSYWNATEYSSNLGMPLMQSFTFNDFYATKRQRQLLFVRLLYTQKLAPGFNVDLRAEPVYDLYSNDLQYSFGLYFNYKL